MINRATAPSHECGRELAAAGCPLDYLEGLPRNSSQLRTLYITEVAGYAESRVFDWDGGKTAQYAIGLRIGTDLAKGAIITDWSFEIPWGHRIYWDRDPCDVVPRSEWSVYEDLYDPRLMAVLDERRVLVRGRPVTGLLCGYAPFESIPKSVPNHASVLGKLTVTLDMGIVLVRTLKLTIDRRAPRALYFEQREGKLFEKCDVRDAESIAERAAASRRSRKLSAIRIRRLERNRDRMIIKRLGGLGT